MSDQERLLPHPRGDETLSRYARWQRDIAELLESSEFHWTIIGLTSADAVFVVSEIAWDLFVRDVCNEEAREEPPIIEMASLLSIVITCCFLLEIPLALFSFGMKYYKHFLHLFDAIVVVVTFVLEVGLHGQEAQIAGLLVLLRLWRLLKLTTAITVSSEEYHETAEQREIVSLKHEIEELKMELKDERRRKGGMGEEQAGTERLWSENGGRRPRGREEVESEGS
ncbi:hypothetical protein BCR35DRAFT_307720 [Leucosporidium creatinivorum]|uniref:Voltage-gated hydrogen channel 1 n=1 Tax=Leucosporidium creatinivorum TaxID=106004 RepID=A0A1Y2ELN4_9BASI|nr:hypothetical protein BCR35DRAFT_307720 [Leucosporidium creatinivorum]